MSPKNKGKYKDKDKDQAPDEAVATWSMRLYQTLRPQALKILAVVAGVAVVLIGLSTWNWYRNRREARASGAFEAVMVVDRGEVVSEDQPPEPTPLPADAPPRFKTYAERATAGLAKYEALEKDFGAAEVTGHTLIIKAGLLYDLGRYDEAGVAYRKFLEQQPDEVLAFLAREGVGFSQEAKALAQADAKARASGLAEALKTWEALDPDEKGKHHDLALFHQARVQALLGDRKKAIGLYQQIMTKEPTSGLQEDVANRLAMLQEQEG